MSRLVFLVLLALNAPALGQGRLSQPAPVAFHLGSFGSKLAARLDIDGHLDSGAGVLQFVDGNSGQALELLEMAYGKGPTLLVGFKSHLGPVTFEASCLASPTSTKGDERLIAAMQIKLSNTTDEARPVHLVAHLAPGGGDPERRPLPSLAFDSGTTFGIDGSMVTRDGLALLRWLGPEPEVSVVPRAEQPDDTVASLVWKFELSAGEVRYLEVKLAGPPAGRAATDSGPGELIVEEDAWRQSLARVTFGRKEERLRWQYQFRGSFSQFRCADKQFWRALVGNVHLLRSFGDIQFGVKSLSDRPYGHPASDQAVEAEILAVFFEWGLSEISVSYLDRLIEELPQRTAGLSAERRLAYVHGLARCVRLTYPSDRNIVLANAILAFVSQPLHVESWLDPAEVREDLGGVLESVGLGDASTLPELQWGLVDPDSIEGRMQTMRRSLTAGDAPSAWEICKQLLAVTAPTGQGSMQRGGEVDGRFSLGMLALQRRMLFDDHGNDFIVFPGVASGLMRKGDELDTSSLPTRFGLMRAQIYYVSAKMIGSWLRLTPSNPYERLIVQLPAGLQGVEVHGAPKGAEVEIMNGGGQLLVDIDLTSPRGSRFTVRVRKTE